jgi:hypothetical protein
MCVSHFRLSRLCGLTNPECSFLPVFIGRYQLVQQEHGQRSLQRGIRWQRHLRMHFGLQRRQVPILQRHHLLGVRAIFAIIL